MKDVKDWEVVLCKNGKFKRELVQESTEERARAEARKRYALDGWYLYNVCLLRVVPSE